ncbi:MAG: cupin domain-containing protein [Prochlorothrix sp.]
MVYSPLAPSIAPSVDRCEDPIDLSRPDPCLDSHPAQSRAPDGCPSDNFQANNLQTNHLQVSADAPTPMAHPANCMIPILNTPAAYHAYRISPEDKNRIVILFDPSHADISLAVCVEIFDPGGHTPRHRHPQAAEMFFVLHGEGLAFCDGKAVALKTGDSILVPPTGNHAIQNSSDRRLYLLSIMVPNEDFIELIRTGTPVTLDAEDLSVLQGLR